MIFSPVNSGSQAELFIDNSLECNDVESPHHLKQMDEGTWRGKVSFTHMCLALGQLRSALLPACVRIKKEKKLKWAHNLHQLPHADKEFRRQQYPVRHTLTQNTSHRRPDRQQHITLENDFSEDVCKYLWRDTSSKYTFWLYYSSNKNVDHHWTTSRLKKSPHLQNT